VRSTNVSQEFRVAQSRDRYNWVAGLYYLHENLAQNQPLFALLDFDSIVGIPLDGIAFRAFDTSKQTPTPMPCSARVNISSPIN
jgi:iron complex outermembrane recepter protein